VDVHFKLKGPSVVLDARPSGGEQPFKNLNIPPERLKPYRPPAPPPVTVRPAIATPPPVAPVSARTTEAAPAAAEAEPVESADPGELEYRVLKSRRAGGAPYILQRGHWEQQKGKRIFKVDWEKGFEDREKADAHVDWVRRHAEELDAVSGSVEG
jgi:hypothetical protein